MSTYEEINALEQRIFLLEMKDTWDDYDYVKSAQWKQELRKLQAQLEREE